MNQLRFLLYFVVALSLLYIPILSDEKKVLIKKSSSEKVVNVQLRKEVKKVVKKVTPQAKKIVKKKIIKKRKVVKKPKPIKKKPLKKKIIKQKPPKPKINEKKILQKKLEKERLEKEKQERLKELEKQKILEEQIERERQKELERQQKLQEQKELEKLKHQKYLASLKEEYYSQIYNTIASKKRYPKKALRFKKEGSVKVSFTILADGSFRDFKIIGPSNDKIFNRAVKKIFKKLHKFEKPPSEIELPLNVTISINYNIKRR